MKLNKIEQSIKSTKESVARQLDSIEAEMVANRLLGDIPEIEDISYISAFLHEEEIHITFNLDSDKKDSKLVHKIAQKLGMKFTKTKSEYENGLDAVGISADGELHIKVQGYVPDTCKLITEEVDLPESEWKTIKTKTVTRVDCGTEETESGEEVPF